MKLYLVFLGALVLGITANAQLFAGNKDGASIAPSVKKVVEAAAKNYSPIRGEVIFQNPQTTEYASLVEPSSALETKIIEYSSSNGEVYSWQSLLLRTESFSEAEQKYKNVYNQLKGMNVVYVVDNYTLNGRYVAATESKKFATSVLTITNPPQALKKLKIEVTLQFEFPEWTVQVNVFDKEKDDSEDGSGMNR